MENKRLDFVSPNKKFPKKHPNKFKRGKSLLGPLPDFNFGPKALTKPDVTRDYGFDPENKTLKWSKPPENILVVKKIDNDTNASFKKLATWLVEEKRLRVFVEEKVIANEDLKLDKNFSGVREKLKSSYHSGQIDLIICLGGDGTLLYAASIFQQSMPPVVAFHSGSLGFLTAHKFENFQEIITDVLGGNAIIMLRSRLKCRVERAAGKKNGENCDISNLRVSPDSPRQLSETHDFTCLVLNEMVVDRGRSHYLCNIDLFLQGRRITSVQGDGLIISTPTGSTAYAVAAGASMVHPEVPSIMITPICPHSLSFRPIIVPPGAELKLTVSESARGPASVCFDGRSPVEIQQGDFVTVQTSVFPTPCVCKVSPFDDWFDSLSTCLHWNSRQQQKKFVPTE